MLSRRRSSARRLTPPYGPTAGMLQGLALLQKATIPRIDEEVLRGHGVAPGNEYKVIGALRFLGLLDDRGHPTESSRQLRTRGATFSLALQDIIRSAYHDLFEHVDLQHASRDEVYNYFVTEIGLGMEMAQKAARFLVGLCQLAGLELSPGLEASARRKTPSPSHRVGLGKPRQRNSLPGEERDSRGNHAGPLPGRALRGANPREAATPYRKGGQPLALGSGLPLPVILALTPQTVDLSEDDLARLFRKMLSAYHRAQREIEAQA